jgi:hypothetical protein
MGSLSKSKLNQIMADWAKEFRTLTRLKQSRKLLKRIGPVILGIEIESFFSYAYRPRFVLISLCEDTGKKCLLTIEQIIFNKKNLQVTINYENHEQDYHKACEEMRDQSRLNLIRNDLRLRDILNAILRDIELTKNIHVPYFTCKAVLELSCLLTDKKERDVFQSVALEAIHKISFSTLVRRTEGNLYLIEQFGKLDKEEIQTRIKANLEKYTLSEVPSVPIDEAIFYS